MKKRTIKEQVQYALLWFVFIWVSCLISILIDLLLVRLLSGFIQVSYMVEAIIHTVCMALGTAAPLAAVSYLISYHLGEFSSLNSSLEGALGLLPQLLLGILLEFPVWVTGGVKWLAGLIDYGTDLYTHKQLSDISLTSYLLAFLLFGLFYVAVKYFFGFIGRDTRIRHRIELTGSPVKPSEKDRTDREIQ